MTRMSPRGVVVGGALGLLLAGSCQAASHGGPDGGPRIDIRLQRNGGYCYFTVETTQRPCIAYVIRMTESKAGVARIYFSPDNDSYLYLEGHDAWNMWNAGGVLHSPKVYTVGAGSRPIPFTCHSSVRWDNMINGERRRFINGWCANEGEQYRLDFEGYDR